MDLLSALLFRMQLTTETQFHKCELAALIKKRFEADSPVCMSGMEWISLEHNSSTSLPYLKKTVKWTVLADSVINGCS
ncbi:MAG: hypothetical protein RJB04_1416 [Verrucomicrobiota bacterium]